MYHSFLNLKIVKIHLHLIPPLWSLLVCKTPHFLGKSYQFRQLLTLFPEGRHPEVTKNLYFVLSTRRSQIPIVLDSSSWTIGARKIKKTEFFVPFILSKGNFSNICGFFQCIVYWIHFLKIHTFTYQKALLHTLHTFRSLI